MKKICKFCGKEFEGVNRSQYCSMLCSSRSQRKRIDRICKICGKKFETLISFVKNGGGIYCSYKCYWESKRKYIMRKCIYCGKIFDAHSTRNNTKYCSRECFRKDKKEKASYTLTCAYCDKKYTVHMKRQVFFHGKEARQYCSKECADRARIGKYTEDKSPNWFGGLTSLQDLIRKSIDYIKTRNKCFKRDNYKSILSGKEGKIEHHHLTPMSILIKIYKITKDNWRKNKNILFDVENTVTITKKEHKLFHSIYGKVTTPNQFEMFKEKYANGVI